jgi:hypothetical protein
MIKPLLFTLGLALLGTDALAAIHVTPAQAAQPRSAAFSAAAMHATTVATIDEDRVMAERLMG